MLQREAAHILVVDDEPDLEPLIRQRFRRRMQGGDFHFTFARDGLEALEILEGQDGVDLVLTDINMPRMDGLTLLAQLENVKDLQRFLRAVVVTAYGDMENIRTAMNRGAFDFLTKPLNLDDLEITIDKACATVAQQKTAALAREAFGRYVSDEVVSTLLDDPEALKLGGEKRRITILLSDIRGFSTISERLPPETVVEILNVYLGKMADVITTHQGTIDEFIGDAILVFFGAPIRRADDALRAVACAVEMQCAMDDVNAELRSRGFPELAMGIGIHSGDVVVGNIGSTKRAKYGAVGSAVNLTGRIESYTVGGQILTTESTLDEAGPAVTIDREMKLSAKGFSQPLSIFEISGVGAPYDLAMPLRKERMVVLEEPLKARFSVLDGKHLTGEVGETAILRLSESGAIARSDSAMDVLSNVHLVVEDRDGSEVGDLYAKVVDQEAGTENKELRFTAVPEEVAELIRSLVS
jgi:class 3 adenylate cyclase